MIFQLQFIIYKNFIKNKEIELYFEDYLNLIDHRPAKLIIQLF